jgi:hypothetical protein
LNASGQVIRVSVVNGEFEDADVVEEAGDQEDLQRLSVCCCTRLRKKCNWRIPHLVVLRARRLTNGLVLGPRSPQARSSLDGRPSLRSHFLTIHFPPCLSLFVALFVREGFGLDFGEAGQDLAVLGFGFFQF